MQKHLLYINLFTITSALALAACADEVDGVVTPDVPEVEEKTPIELSVGGTDVSPLTRVVISDGTGKTLSKLPNGSSIYMLMKADDLSTTPQTTLCTRTVGFAQDITEDATKSNVSFTASGEGAKFARYWDDVFARKSAISIAAVCTPGYGPIGGLTSDSKAWRIGGDGSFIKNEWIAISSMGSTAPNLIWPVGYTSVVGVTDQSSTSPDFITYQDLCFSNNIGNNTSQGKGDTRLKFNEETKKFGSGTLVFYHALSKLTFNIKQGEGFSDSEFKFQTGTNIKLSNFNNGGTFNISTGEFEGTLTKTDINKIFQRTLTTTETTAGIKFGLDALVIPGTDLSATGASSTNAVTFILAGNEYKLSMAQLYAAFTDEQKTQYFESGKLKAGVHYVFTFTVAKTKISGLSAQILDWEEVDASNINPTNARISLQLEDRGTAVTTGVNFYRAKDTGNSAISDTYKGYEWSTGYEIGSGNFSDNTWQPTNWYWPDNTTFYHFRAVGDKSESSPAAPEVYSDAFTLTAGQTYKDYIWGAPFYELDGSYSAENNAKLTYSTSKGFDGTGAEASTPTHQIYHGIGPTDDPIKLLMFHMMSDLTFNIKTTTGDDQVTLVNGDDKTMVSIVNFSPVGKVLLGNGSVVPNEKDPSDIISAPVDWNSESPTGTHVYKYGVVPQDLDGVQLYITTPDNNQYIVDLKDVKAATVNTRNIANPYSQSESKYVIDKWYPGFKYVYTFTLKKKGIADISATVVNWETVETDKEEVTIQ